MVRKYHRFLRFSFWRAFNEGKNPHDIATGFALGVFIGLGPTFGFQIILAVLLAIRLRASKIGAVLGVFVTNPITLIPIYSFELFLGDWLLQGLVNPQIAFFHRAIINLDFNTLFELGSDTLLAFLIGSFFLATLSGLIIYFIVKSIVYSIQAAKDKVNKNNTVK